MTDEPRQHEPECMCDMPDEDRPEFTTAELEELEANEVYELYEVDEDDAGVEAEEIEES